MARCVQLASNILKITVAGKLLPSVFTVVLWVAFLQNLQQLKDNAEAGSQQARKSRSVKLSYRWIKISCGIISVLLVINVLEHMAYQVGTLRHSPCHNNSVPTLRNCTAVYIQKFSVMAVADRVCNQCTSKFGCGCRNIRTDRPPSGRKIIYI
jgi:hypothetical protein